MAEEVARVYRALPPQDRARASIFGQNYGQAGAVDLYREELGLPHAISGHLTYFLWGPGDATGEVIIVLDDDRETLEQLTARSSSPTGFFTRTRCRTSTSTSTSAEVSRSR